MNKINFLRKSETSQLLFQAHPRKSLSRGVVLVSFWLLSICSVWSQTAPNINYATPNNYLLNASITPLAPVNTGGIVPALTYQRVSTFAGTATGFLDGIGTAAKMDGPLGMKMAANGDIYFIDGNNFRIRKLNTQTGAVTTIAGDGYNVFFAGRLRNDTNGALASFNYPTDLAIDAVNNCLYVADKENDVIRKVSLVAPYAVTTFAGSGTSSSVDGTGLAARFKKPSGIVIDPTGTFLYVTDRAGNKIRRITISTAVVTTIAGSGTQSTVDNTTGTTATFNDPTGIAVDANFIYVTDFGGHKIRKIANTSPFTVTTLAGSGTSGTVDNTTGALATFDNPYGISLDPAGNLFVAEWGNKIRKITASGAVTTFAGSGASTSVDGIGTIATFDSPAHIVINPTSGVGYVSEWIGDRIRKIELGGYVINPTPALPTGISFDITTGTFSGTPTAINNGPKNYTITGYNYYGSSTATVAIATGTLPVIAGTTEVSAITSSSATSGGNVTSNGLTTFTGGAALLEKGICWSTSANPTILDSKLADSIIITGSFTSNITGLTPLTTYFARAYATNVLGTAYGTQVSFTTPIAPPDISYSASNVFTLNTAITPLQVTNAGGLIPSQFKDNVTTFAGSDFVGSTDGVGASATFNFAAGVGLALDASGNLYVGDSSNHKIRKITPAGVVSTFAGSGTAGFNDASGALASFSEPIGVTVGSTGTVYVADKNNARIRAITSAGVVSTVAGTGNEGATDGLNSVASFTLPTGVALDESIGVIYVAEKNSHKIRAVDLDGAVFTYAGNGTAGSINATGAAARFNSATEVAVDATGNVFVSDVNNNRIRKITRDGAVTTHAGGIVELVGSQYSLWNPRGVAVDAAGNVYVADKFNHKIRKITPAGVVITLAGGIQGTTDGSIANARFDFPEAVAVGTDGTLYIADRSRKIRKIVSQGYSITPALPAGLVFNADGSITGTPTVVSPATAYTITAANAGGSSSFTVNITVVVSPPAISYTTTNQFTAYTAITALQATNTGGVIPSQLKGSVSTLAGTGASGADDGAGAIARFQSPRSVAVDAAGIVYVGDSNNNRIRKITPAGVVSTLAGSLGFGVLGMVIDFAGNVYIADTFNHVIRKITASGVVSIFAGSGTEGSADGTSTAASFAYPYGLTMDAAGFIYVADSNNHKIRKISPNGAVSTLAGSGVQGATDAAGTAASFSSPRGVTVDTAGNVYVADYGNRKIRKIDANGAVTTIAGNGVAGFADGSGTSASFNGPNAVAVDAAGNVYVGDTFNHKIRKITPAGVVSTLAGSGIVGFTNGADASARFNNPWGVALDAAGNIYVADSANNQIRKIANEGYSIVPALPAGLVLNANGSITGTPTVGSPATNYTITATNAGGSASFTISIAVNAVASIATWTGSQWINQNLLNTVNPAIIEGEFTPSTSFEVGSLTIKNNAIVNVNSGINLTVNGKLTVEPGSTLTLDSNANLLQTTDVTNSGLISINRNTAPLKLLDYVLWSSPVSDQQLQSFSSATLSNRFYTYNAGTNLYNAVADPSTTLFATGKGYLIRMPNNHPLTPTIWKGTFTGVPNNGTVNLSVTSGTYNAIGNPYPSTIDTNAFIDANGITEALYFWRKTNNSDNPSYASYTKAGGIATALAADPNGLVPNGVLQVGQGFIVKSASNAISFTNAMRTANNGNQFLRTKNDNKSRIWLNLTNASGFFSQTMVAYMDGATSGIDAAIDGRYFNDCPTALTSIITNEEFSIQGRSLPFDTSDVVPLGFKTETAGEFSLAIDHTDGLFAAGQKVFLQDKVTNTVNDLSIGTYKFTTDAGVFNSRFALMYQNTLSIDDADALSNQVMVYKQNEKISIDAGSIIMEAVKVYDLNGRLLFDRNNINANQFAFSIATATDVLLIKMTSTDGKVISKKIIN